MINKRLHLAADEQSTYFTKQKFMNDYSACFSAAEQDDPNVCGRFSHQNFEQNCLYEASITDRIKAGHIWEVDHLWDRNFEDCDSESDEEDNEQWNLENPGKYKAV